MSASKDTMALQSPDINISNNNSNKSSNVGAHVFLIQCKSFGAIRVQPKASTAQDSAAQHSTAQHSTAQHSTAQHSTHGTHHLNTPAAVVAMLDSQLPHLPVLVSSPSHLPPGASLVPLPPAGVHPLTWWGRPSQPGGHCSLLQALSLQYNHLVEDQSYVRLLLHEHDLLLKCLEMHQTGALNH